MGSDSINVLLLNGSYKVCRGERCYTRSSKIFPIKLNSFKGLLGYVGTERIIKMQMRDWLVHFTQMNGHLTLPLFCKRLADDLSMVWKRGRLRTGLWVFIAGYENRDPKFWYINNIGNLDQDTLRYSRIGPDFFPVNDLDNNYISEITRRTGFNKVQIMKMHQFNFRNGVLFPFLAVYQHYTALIKHLLQGADPGFKTPRRLKHAAFLYRQRFEFLKRLFSAKHGIYRKRNAPVGGEIKVFTVSPSGSIHECYKEQYHKLSPACWNYLVRRAQVDRPGNA